MLSSEVQPIGSVLMPQSGVASSDACDMPDESKPQDVSDVLVESSCDGSQSPDGTIPATCRMCGGRTDLAPVHEVWTEPGYRFWRCRDCGSETSDLAYQLVWYEDFRRDDYFLTQCGGWDNVLAQLNFNVELFEGWSGGSGSLHGKRFLDVGYCDGAMLARMTEKGCECWGYDVSAEYSMKIAERAEIPHQRLVHGLEKWTHLAGEIGTFDLVQAREVIEHVPNPWSFMRGIASLLAPGGLAQIQTPLPNGVNSRIPYQRFHITLLSPIMLRAVGMAYGLEVVDNRFWSIGHLVILRKPV